MKEKIKNNKKYIKETIFLLLGGIIINLACFLMGTIYSHAEPYESAYFPITSGYNPNDYPIDDEYIKGLFSDPTVCMIKVYWENSVSHPDWYSIYVLHDSSVTLATPFFLYGEVYTSNPSRFDVRSSSSISGIYIEHYQYRDGAWSPLMDRFDGQFWNFTNLSSTNAEPRNIYYVKENLNKDSATGLTLIYGMVKEVVNPGEFTDLPGLDEILNNIQNTWQPPSNITGHALPSQPSENPNNNDFQNRLQMFDYLKDTLTALIGNLGYNLANWFNALIGKLVEGFNSVSQNIYNGFKTLMDNIKDFFGPKIDAIIDKFNYITEPFNSQELADNLNNGAFSSDFLGLITTVSTFANTFTSATEPQSCSFTLDLRNNGYFSFGLLTFSFDWILPFRSTIRLILGCLCVYSLIVSIFTSINTYIGGTSSINDDI